MGRKTNPEQLQKARRILADQPGHRSAEYARWMGYHREAFSRLLVELNDQGFLLWEDDQGRLWLCANSWQKQ